MIEEMYKEVGRLSAVSHQKQVDNCAHRSFLQTSRADIASRLASCLKEEQQVKEEINGMARQITSLRAQLDRAKGDTQCDI